MHFPPMENTLASVEIVLYNSEKCTFHQWKMYFTQVENVLSTDGKCTFHKWKMHIPPVENVLSTNSMENFFPQLCNELP